MPDMGLIRDLRLDGGTAHLELIVTSPLCTQIGLIVDRVREVLAEVDGVGSVEVTVDAGAGMVAGHPDDHPAGPAERLE